MREQVEAQRHVPQSRWSRRLEASFWAIFAAKFQRFDLLPEPLSFPLPPLAVHENIMMRHAECVCSATYYK
jgi:hypothetical protein